MAISDAPMIHELVCEICEGLEMLSVLASLDALPNSSGRKRVAAVLMERIYSFPPLRCCRRP